MEYDDQERLQISEDRRPVSRGLQWCQQPVSSRPVFLLCCVCAGLIIINIAITISSRGPRGNEEESETSSQEGELLMSESKPRTIRLPPENETLDGACPDDWSQLRDSCYYISNLAKSWKEAYKMCQRRKAKLTVINTQEEQVFLSRLAMKIRFWIGLSEIDGEWKWVDGTPFDSTPKKWSPGQPDDYFGHGLGGGEDCGMLFDDGNWNDEHCTRPYRYICEKASVVAQ